MNADFNVCPCGGDHELACGRFLIDAYRLADESCDDAHLRALARHAEECRPCAREYSIERNVKALVGRCCGQERAPESLRSNVQQRIQALTVQMTQTVVSDGVQIVRTTHTVISVNEPGTSA